MSQMEPAFQNAGGVMETRTVKMGATRRTVKAPDGCVTPRPSSPAKTQVETRHQWSFSVTVTGGFFNPGYIHVIYSV